MKAQLNKRERLAAQLLQHYATCERLAEYLGVSPEKIDGKKISVALFKIERATSEASAKYCNGEINLEAWETAQKRAAYFVGNAIGIVPPGFFVNGDPRGYALKIDNETPEGKILIEAVKMHTDMGGYGILSPEITGN